MGGSWVRCACLIAPSTMFFGCQNDVLNVDLLMTLGELAVGIGSTPKRVINTLNALGGRRKYTDALAARLAITLAVHDSTGIPIRRAFQLAATALRDYSGAAEPVVVRARSAHAGVVVDVRRILSECATRLSAARTLGTPARGRPRGRRDAPLRAAEEWGLDLSLMRTNLALTPEDRLRQLDGMAAFSRDVRRRARRS